MQPDPSPKAVDDAASSLLEGLSRPSQDMLLQLLIYKAIFLGRGFRQLAERESAETREVLMRIHMDSAAEGVGLALAMREWDAHPAGLDGILESAEEARMRFLQDVLALKESVVDVGLAAAMRAPDDRLRRRFMALADMDRKHADALRRVLGATPVEERLDEAPPEEDGVTVGVGTRGDAPNLGRAVEAALREIARRGAKPVAIVVSGEALRHARDEGLVDAATGRMFELPVEVDLGWRGDAFAIQTSERVGFAEIITGTKAPPEEEGLRPVENADEGHRRAH